LVVEIDRRRAIEIACSTAGAGDVVVIAGRGHEATQTIAGVEVPFGDADVARQILGAGK